MVPDRTPRVLVVEDDEEIAQVLQRSLRMEGYEVRTSADGEAALADADAFSPDLVILDLGLPRLDGMEVARRLREGDDVPILMLTARDAVESRVEGLDAGADGYLTKPFDFRELLARVRALTRRERRPMVDEKLTIRHITIDMPSRRVWRHGIEIALTTREFALLEYLARRAGEVVGRADIAEHVWDEHYDAFSNVVDVYVQRLRRKLDDSGGESLIRTRRGQGYQLL